MDKQEKARLLKSLQQKFGIDEVICLNNGDKLPMEDFIAWVYERKDLDEMVIQDRKKAFGLTLKPFFDDRIYPRQFLAEFFEYWTEQSKDGKRLRFELEKTWSLAARLRRFAKNSKYKIKIPPSEMDFLDGKIERNNKPFNSEEMFH
jgi:hypothetical protein